MISPHADTDGHVAALIRARQILQTEPQNASAHFEQALALCQLGKWEQALDSWRQVVCLEPDNAFAYIDMGVVLLEQGQWTQAEQVFAQAVRCAPNQAAAHYGLGMAQAQQGRQEEARAAWEQTLRLEPDHRDAKTNLAVLQTLAAENSSPLVECVVTSQVNLLVTPENMQEAAGEKTGRAFRENERVSSPAQESKVFLSASDTSHKPRITLPPAVGPSLSAIAGTVITAQSQPPPDSSVLLTDTPAADQDAAHNGQGAVEPTLRLDAKALQQEHRALDRQSRISALNLVSRRHLTAIGTVAVGLLIVAGWNVQKKHSPVQPSVPNEASATVVLPVAATDSTVSRNEAAQPADPSASDPGGNSSALVPPASSAPSASRRTTLANAVPSASNFEGHSLRPHSSHPLMQHTSAQENDAVQTVVRSHSPRPRRTKRVVSAVEAAQVPAPRHPSAPKHTIASHRAFGGDEDTFAAHAQPRHTDNGDEWTDKIP